VLYILGKFLIMQAFFVSVCTVLTVVLEVFCALGMPVYSNPLLGSLLLFHEFIHPPLTCLLSDFILGHHFFPYLYFSFALRFLIDQSVMCVGSKRKFVTRQLTTCHWKYVPPPRHSLWLLDLPQIIILLFSCMNYCVLM